jgi:hypothetical protein
MQEVRLPTLLSSSLSKDMLGLYQLVLEHTDEDITALSVHPLTSRVPMSQKIAVFNFRVLLRPPPIFNHCHNTDYHVYFKSLPHVPPVAVRGLKFWAVQNFVASHAVPISPRVLPLL